MSVQYVTDDFHKEVVAKLKAERDQARADARSERRWANDYQMESVAVRVELAAVKAAARELLDAAPICECKLKDGSCFASCTHYYIGLEMKALGELIR